MLLNCWQMLYFWGVASSEGSEPDPLSWGPMGSARSTPHPRYILAGLGGVCFQQGSQRETCTINRQKWRFRSLVLYKAGEHCQLQCSPNMDALTAVSQPASLGSQNSHPENMAWAEHWEKIGKFGDRMGIREMVTNFAHGICSLLVLYND